MVDDNKTVDDNKMVDDECRPRQDHKTFHVFFLYYLHEG